jgi:uncharacterized membrane protein YcaP (DUF421 family)
MVDDDHSLANAFIMVTTFVVVDISLSLLKQRSKTLAGILEDAPLVLVENGQPLMDRMNKSRIDTEDVLEAARETRGLERMDQIKYAVLERHGKISIIPQPTAFSQQPA